MPGLLDARGGFDDPITMGLLGASQALLTPMSQGGGLGAAFGAFPAAQQQAQQQALRQQYMRQQMEGQQSEAELRKMQILAAQRKAEKDAELQAMIQGRLGSQSAGAFASGAAQGSVGPTNANAQRLQQGGGFPFSMQDVLAVKAAGGPDFLEAYKFANTPEKLESGSTYRDRITGIERYMPKVGEGQRLNADGSVSVSPGYPAAQTEIIQAAELAKLPFGPPIRTKNAQGQELLLSPDQFYFATRPQVPQAPQPSSASAAPVMPSAQPNASGQMGLAFGEPNQAQDARQAANKNSELINANWIKTYEKIVEDGANAGKSIVDMQLLRSMDLKTGIGVQQQAWAANMLRGIHPTFESYAARAEKFGTIATDTTLQKQLEQAGVATKSDTELAARVGPSIAKTPEANAFAMDYIEAVARVKEQKARYYQAMRTAAQESGEPNLSVIDKRWAELQRKTPALSVFGQPTMQRWAPKP